MLQLSQQQQQQTPKQQLISSSHVFSSLLSANHNNATKRWDEKFAQWIMGSRASYTTSLYHRDSNRSSVGWTAFLVALVRAIESSPSPLHYDYDGIVNSGGNDNDEKLTLHDGLYHDPVGIKMFSLFNYNGAPLLTRILFALFRCHNYFSYSITTATATNTGSEKNKNTKSIYQSPLWIISRKLSPELETLSTMVAVRTHFIDKHIRTSLLLQHNQHKIQKISEESLSLQHRQNDHRKNKQKKQQLVIIGSGLDSRAFRLSSLLEKTGTTVFEVDFPGMLEEKVRLFRSCGIRYNNNHFVDTSKSATEVSSSFDIDTKLVGADMTKPEDMKDKLLEKGFDNNLFTVWVLEGVTSYLLKKELDSLLSVIQSLSSSKTSDDKNDNKNKEGSHKDSTIIATWLTSKLNTKISMHKFFLDRYDTDNNNNASLSPITMAASEIVASYGFSTVSEVTSVKNAGEKLNRPGGSNHYILSSHDMN